MHSAELFKGCTSFVDKGINLIPKNLGFCFHASSVHAKIAVGKQ